MNQQLCDQVNNSYVNTACISLPVPSPGLLTCKYNLPSVNVIQNVIGHLLNLQKYQTIM